MVSPDHHFHDVADRLEQLDRHLRDGAVVVQAHHAVKFLGRGRARGSLRSAHWCLRGCPPPEPSRGVRQPRSGFCLVPKKLPIGLDQVFAFHALAARTRTDINTTSASRKATWIIGDDNLLQHGYTQSSSSIARAQCLLCLRHVEQLEMIGCSRPSMSPLQCETTGCNRSGRQHR